MYRDRSVDSEAVTGFVRRSFLTGAAIAFPVLVTFVAISFAWNVVTGFLINVSEERVTDVDMSVDEGISAVMTSGVAVGKTVEGRALSTDDVERRADGGLEGRVVDPDTWPTEDA